MDSLEPARKKIKIECPQESDSIPTSSTTDTLCASGLEINDLQNKEDDSADELDEEDEFDDLFYFDGNVFDDENDASNPDDEVECYKPMNRDQLAEKMNAILAEANEILKNENVEIVRALMTHYQWEKLRLLEIFYDSGKEKCLNEAGIEVAECMKISEEGKSCCICLDSEIEITKLACSHAVCENCVTEHIGNEVKKRKSCIQCPACKVPIKESKVIQILGASSNEFQYNLIEGFVNTNRYIKWCTSPDTQCGLAIVVSDFVSPEQIQSVTCNCKNSFCFACGNISHQPLPCHILTKWMLKHKEEVSTSSIIKTSTVAYFSFCPKCKSPIEKTGGCNNMICGNCRHNFCWICMGNCRDSWKCNRFPKVKASSSTLFLEEVRFAADDSERFIFYQNRFNIHEQSFNLEKMMRPRIDEAIEFRKNVQSYPKDQFDFFDDALQTLSLARNTLMWTFAYAYYIKQSGQSNIFEENQAHLQEATEKLSGLIETEIGTLLSNGEQNVFKGPVLDATEYCRQRRKALLLHTQDGTLELDEKSE